jgi:hypothetical protein
MRMIALLPVALLSCAPQGPAPCPAGTQPALEATLFLGRNIGGRPGVSDADFARFLNEDVTPRFPDGLTVLDAAGQWRGDAGRVERERSKVLVLVVPDDAATRQRLAEVADAYKRRFRQESVLTLTRGSCRAG